MKYTNTNALIFRAVARLKKTDIIAAIGAEKKSVQPIADVVIPNAAPKHNIKNKQAILEVIKMERLRSYYDGDRQDRLSVPITYRTDQNQNELYCSMCGETAYVNAVFFDDITRIIEETLENPFLCQECVELYDEAAYRN